MTKQHSDTSCWSCGGERTKLSLAESRVAVALVHAWRVAIRRGGRCELAGGIFHVEILGLLSLTPAGALACPGLI